MPRRPPILVEGPRLFPKLVAPLLTSPYQAVWLMPTPEFARESAERRDKPQGRFESSDPERYRENFLRRDALLAEYIGREVAARGLVMIEVDGSRSPTNGRSDRRALCALPRVALGKLSALIRGHYSPKAPLCLR